jgi:hypothetical protein
MAGRSQKALLATEFVAMPTHAATSLKIRFAEALDSIYALKDHDTGLRRGSRMQPWSAIKCQSETQQSDGFERTGGDSLTYLDNTIQTGLARHDRTDARLLPPIVNSI